ncbi:MAG: polyphosphate kinase 1 [Flavobacteriales bacterium]|nr:polyphosphate kinase 1 [Flavobacteriales bacterium]
MALKKKGKASPVKKKKKSASVTLAKEPKAVKKSPVKKLEKTELINRDLSWLSFNARVLQEASDDRVPLIERLRFLGIFSSNMDEFFRVRVATLRRMTLLDNRSQKEFGFDPRKILEKISKTIALQQREFDLTFQIILKKLAAKGIHHVNEKQLSKEQGEFVREYFNHTVRQTLVPIMLDKKSKHINLKDKMIYLAIKLSRKNNTSDYQYALIEVPTQIVSRFVVLPVESKDKTSIILLDDVIRYCLGEIFSIFDYDLHQAYTIKLTRDAELDIDDDVQQGLVEKVQKSLKKRKQGQPVRFIYDQEMPPDLLLFILKKLKIENNENITPGGRYHNFKDFIKFPGIGDPSLQYEPLKPLIHPELHGQRSILDVVRKKDVLLNFPYQSFEYIIELLREAAIDPKVTHIQINLYRVGEKSKIINALINAAKNGKQVTAVVELQARFDEENNIKLSRKLQDEGVKVIYGVPGLKVHSKLILITRKDKKREINFAHVGTGNFHEVNARIYTDFSLLTADDRITTEVEKVFDFFRKNYERANFKYLFVSPFNARKRLIELVQQEIYNAKREHDAWIHLKLNNLVDEEMIRWLYRASQAGVKIKIVVRGICSLVPGIKGLSENIEAISIVDRYLEHARVFVFCNDGKELVYISSADWMQRNLDGRIEVSTPIFDPTLRKEILDLMNIQLSGESKARIIDKDQLNKYKGLGRKSQFRSQMETYSYLKKRLHSGK